MELLMHEGRVLRVPRIDRGPRIVDTEEQWRTRQWRTAGKMTALLLATYGSMWLIAFYTVTTPSQPERDAFEEAMGHGQLALLIALIIPFVTYVLGVRAAPAMAGVYATGVQFPGFGGWLLVNVFVPFGQIERVRKVRALAPPGTVRLDIRGLWYPVRMFRWVFGAEGIDAVRRAVEGRVPPLVPDGAPRLFVYGPSNPR